MPQSEVKFVEVVRKVRERYPGKDTLSDRIDSFIPNKNLGAWEGQLESSCVHLMKTAYKK